MKKSNEPIQAIIDLCKTMIEIADDGDAVQEDNSCGVLYGVLRDCAYKIKMLAEEEKAKHKNKGTWE
jgi:hypothetical protein